MPENENTYEIALVMAGAISAGAYTAGVVDYLLEALMHYQKVRKQFAEDHPGKSLHNVQIRVISGASAGGMTGTMLLSAMMDETYKPMSDYNPAIETKESDIKNNVFYRSWVSKDYGIDISYMLDPSDVTGKAPLKSLLNCKRLGEIADNALQHPRILQKYDYIPERIDHFLSVFNLGGIPYMVDFDGSDSQYGLMNHSDMMHFVHINHPNVISDNNEIILNASTNSELDTNWLLLKKSTLATGAFPLALEYQEIEKNIKSYEDWKWWVPQEKDISKCPDQNSTCFTLTTIPPNCVVPAGTHYSMVAVDGGVANNEPLEVARRQLAGKKLFNPRDPKDAKRSVIMIDPFPAEPLEPFSYENKTLFNIAAKLFGSLKEQARFKPEELQLAANSKIFSRYLIAPSQIDTKRGEELASSSFGAFGGFLSEKFRQHDFQLGRKNAQSFLQQYFYIGINNELVEKNLDWFVKNQCMVKKNDTQYVQIIPMVDLPDQKIKYEIPLMDFNSIAMTQNEFESLMQKIEVRVKTIFEKSYLLNKFIDGEAENYILGCFKFLMKWDYLKGKVISGISSFMTNKLSKKIKDDLENRQLLK